MNRLTLRIQLLAICSVLSLSLATGPQAMAALTTSLVNGDFESPPTGAFESAPIPGWNRSTVGYNAGSWGNALNGLYGFPAFVGLQSGALVAHTYPNNQPEISLYQSLGTVDASDVGKTFYLDALFGARGFDGAVYNGDLSARFAVGAEGSTPVGTVGVLNVAINGASPFGLTAAPQSSFTPTAGDIGTEVFASLHLFTNVFNPVDESQFVVDSVGLTSVPEPSSCLLVLAAAFGAFCVRRMR